jgi:hypothetical protein
VRASVCSTCEASTFTPLKLVLALTRAPTAQALDDANISQAAVNKARLIHHPFH